MNKRQSGFTLVEIAIVLVIIGLLLGGVLKGQEMIANSRLQEHAEATSRPIRRPSTRSRIASARCPAISGRRPRRLRLIAAAANGVQNGDYCG